RERRRVVLAEAFARVEQEFVDGLRTEARGPQGVAERLPREVVERAANQRLTGETLCLPIGDERDGARARAFRHVGEAMPLVEARRFERAVARVRDHAVIEASSAVAARPGDELIVRRHHEPPGLAPAPWHVEREGPTGRAGLEQ